MKSGPTLADATGNSRRRSAAISPVATVVLPTPECAPPMTTRAVTVLSDRWVPAPNDRTQRSQPGEPVSHCSRIGVIAERATQGDTGFRAGQSVGVDRAARSPCARRRRGPGGDDHGDAGFDKLVVGVG